MAAPAPASGSSHHGEINFRCGPGTCRGSIQVTPLSLRLRSTFGTAHSALQQRSNALVTIAVTLEDGTTAKGTSEVGLPPKKPSCYMADINDVIEACDIFAGELRRSLQDDSRDEAVPRRSPGTFTGLTPSPFTAVLCEALRRLDEALPPSTGPHKWNAGKFGIEAALFAMWCDGTQTPFQTLAFSEIKAPVAPRNNGYFTIAMSGDDDEVIQSIKLGASHTPNLKFKANEDVGRLLWTLQKAREICTDTRQRWSIDANASWSPTTTRRMLEEVIGKFKEEIWMIEQPFPPCMHTDGTEEERTQWVEILSECNTQSVALFADESCSTIHDVSLLRPFVTGVNIKLEKCGGLRDALALAVLAREASLQVWIGTMVGSTLNSSIASQLLTASDVGGDVDGSLLVDPASDPFRDGFTWDSRTGLISFPTTPAFGVLVKEPDA